MIDAFTRWSLDRGGFFTRAEAKDYGYSDSQIQAAVRDGVWVRLRHGYYSFSDHVASLDPRARHVLLSRAVLHRLGLGYVLVGVSACAAHGIDQWDTDLTVVRVSRLSRRPGKHEAGIRFHNVPLESSRDVTRASGMPAVRADLAVWQAACELSTESALVCMNSAMNTQATSRENLLRVAPAFSSWAGSRTARLAFRLSDPRVETVGESRTLFLCWELKLPRPQAQYDVINGQGVRVARTDFAWLQYRHVAEFDGTVKYVRYLRPGETASDAVIREKRREDLVRAEQLGMSRLIWLDLEGRRRLRTAQALWSGLDQSARLYTRNRTVIDLGTPR